MNTEQYCTSHLTTVFAPQFLDTNPYQKQLAAQLINLGIQVEGVDSKKIFLPSAVKQWKPNILHLHWLHKFFQASTATKSTLRLLKFISGVIILKLMGTKIVWTAHNLHDHENANPLLDRICTSVVVRLADAIIAHCEAAKCEIHDALNVSQKDKIFVLPHGNYVNYYQNKIEKLEARKILGIPESKVVFLFLGLIRPYKGVFELIEAFKQLHSDEVQLAIAGKTWNEELTKEIQNQTVEHNNIEFVPGFVPDDQIQVYMNACDVVVFPYRDVLTSGAVVLAMSFGKTCIAPRKGCIGEILDHSGSFLYDPDTEDGLFQALNYAVENRSELTNIGKHNKQIAEQWNWENISKMTLNVYNHCLSK